MVVLRWLIIRLRRVLLLPTVDSTTPITAEQVAPHMRRLIASDIHMGGGDRLDDFEGDGELVDFIHSYAMSAGADRADPGRRHLRVLAGAPARPERL